MPVKAHNIQAQTFSVISYKHFRGEANTTDPTIILITNDNESIQYPLVQPDLGCLNDNEKKNSFD